NLGIVAVRHGRGMQQLNIRGIAFDRRTVVLQDHVIDATADQTDRTANTRRIDLNAATGGKRGFAARTERGACRRAAGYALSRCGAAWQIATCRAGQILRLAWQKCTLRFFSALGLDAGGFTLRL